MDLHRQAFVINIKRCAVQVMPELVDHLRKAWTTSIQGVMRKEEAESTLPVNHPVESIQNTEDLFDQITYSKGFSNLPKFFQSINFTHF